MGRKFRLSSEVVLDLDQFRRALGIAKNEAQGTGDTMGGKLREGLSVAADAAITLGVSFEGVKKAYDLVFQSVERLQKRFGTDDPAVMGFQELRTSVLGAFDAFTRGILSSGAAQRAMRAISDQMTRAGEAAESLGEQFDLFVQSHAEQIIATAAPVAKTFAVMAESFNVMRGSFVVAVGVIEKSVTSLFYLIDFLREKLRVAAKYWGFDESSKGLNTLFGDLSAVNDELDRIADRNVLEGLSRIRTSFFVGIPAAIAQSAQWIKALQELLEKLEKERKKLKPGGVLLEDVDADRTLRDSLESIATSTTEIFEGATAQIANMFESLAVRMFDIGDRGAKQLYEGFAGFFGGLTALGAQAEAAFGKSSSAARAFAKVQLGIQAVTATASGFEELGKSLSAKGDFAFARAIAHGLSSAAFFTAAGIAGGRAISAIGTAAPREDRSITQGIDQQVGKREAVIQIIVQGDMVDHRDYVRSYLVPALRDLVDEEDVEVVATTTVIGSEVSK